MLLALAVGCGGPSDETRIEELRLVALAAEPPAVDPGAAYALTATVADPLGEGGDLLVWSCPPSGACDVALAPIDAAQRVVPQTAHPARVVWAVACAPGQCGDLAAISDETLRDPVAWLAQLPITGVSAAMRAMPIAVDTGAAVNPALDEAPPDWITGDSEVGAPLVFSAPGARFAYGYATAGAFSAPRYEVAGSGAVTLTWFAADDGGAGELFVVLEDGNGGVTVWLGAAK